MTMADLYRITAALAAAALLVWLLARILFVIRGLRTRRRLRALKGKPKPAAPPHW